MNETMKTILERRSIRRFTDEPVPDEILRQLAEAAMHAPSGQNLKTWKFTVVSSSKMIKKLAEAMRVALGRDSYDMYGPAALLIPTNERESVFGPEDNACALQNVFLAAHSLGVGSVWINQLRRVCDVPEVRGVMNEMHIPASHVVYGLAALGYADSQAPVRPYSPGGEVEFIR